MYHACTITAAMAQVYASLFLKPDGMPYISSGRARPMPGAPALLGTTPEIEELRPRSPPK